MAGPRKTVKPIAGQADDLSRCAICGWPLMETAKEGCVRGNCSMRPYPAHVYAPARAQSWFNVPLEKVCPPPWSASVGFWATLLAFFRRECPRCHSARSWRTRGWFCFECWVHGADLPPRPVGWPPPPPAPPSYLDPGA